MIRHIVLFRLHGDATERADGVERLRAALEPLADTVPGVRSLRVDGDGSGVDWHWHASLVSEHESWEALAAYQVHPAHVAVLGTVIAEVAAEKAVVDLTL